MEAFQERPPASFSHNPEDLKLPEVPKDGLLIASPPSDVKLPHIRSILAPEFCDSPVEIDAFRPLSVILPPIDPGHPHMRGMRPSGEATVISPTDSMSVMSVEGTGQRSTSVVSLDDPDVRMAAEALSGLGNPDFARSSPQIRNVSSHAGASNMSRAQGTREEAEPLLELLAQAHPWVAGTVNGSMTAYSTTKYYSPRIVQYGANLVERSIGNPMVSTVTTVGRMTGVESGLRRYLGSGRPSDLERGSPGRSKRRRTGDDGTEVDRPSGEGLRRGSHDSAAEPLPLYGASKPPSYREEYSPAARDRNGQRPPHNRSWSMQAAGQIFASTSGLTVALHERSRHSLRYCLHLLSGAAQHVDDVMRALSLVLRDYDSARESYHRSHKSSMEKGDSGERERTPDHDDAARELANIIKRHSDDIWETIKNIVNSISTYAGGALPDNARSFVRTQLLSLPQRWRVATDGASGESETSRHAHRMVAFAREGIDMMAQLSQVMKVTLESAEKWLAMVGRRERDQQQAAVTNSGTNGEKVDQEMTGVEEQRQQSGNSNME